MRKTAHLNTRLVALSLRYFPLLLLLSLSYYFLLHRILLELLFSLDLLFRKPGSFLGSINLGLKDLLFKLFNILNAFPMVRCSVIAQIKPASGSN